VCVCVCACVCACVCVCVRVCVCVNMHYPQSPPSPFACSLRIFMSAHGLLRICAWIHNKSPSSQICAVSAGARCMYALKTKEGCKRSKGARSYTKEGCVYLYHTQRRGVYIYISYTWRRRSYL